MIELLLTIIVIISMFIGIAITIQLIINNRKLKKRIEELLEANAKIISQKKSSEVRLGQISEHLVPFLEEFKYDPKNIKFLGQPIDYICFEQDKIVFLEIKTGEAQLSPKQRNIKSLIENKQVYWDEFRLSAHK